MKRPWRGAVLGVVLGIVGVLALWPGGAGTVPPDRELMSRSPGLGPVLEEMARRQGVSLGRFRVDPAGMALEQTLTGQFRLTEYLMAEPLRTPATVEAFARHLASTRSVNQQIAFLSTLAWPSGRLLSGRIPPSPERVAGSLEGAVELLYKKTGKRFQGPDREQVLREAKTLPSPVREPMARVLTDIYTAALIREAVVKESEFKLGGAFGVRSKRTSDRLRAFLSTWWGADSLSTKDFETVVAGLQTVDLTSLYEAGQRLAQGLEEGAHTLAATDMDMATPDFQFEWFTPRGRIAVGGTGANTYQGSFLFVLDLGGDDRYTGPGAVSGVEPASLVMDLGGNDRYESEGMDRAGPGGAILGYAAVVDLGGGTDSYASQSWGGGFGFLGMGWIQDDGGDDTYRMSWLSQGAGMFGIGILFDGGGNDEYFLPAPGDTLPWGRGQGFAGPSGIGLLLDGGGDDSYLLGETESASRSIVHVQGTASGVKPYHSGGLGFLIDVAGNDRYEADARAQGAGSDGGLGALIDLAGADVYRARTLAQGVGSGRGVGVLLDGKGDDEHSLTDASGGSGLGVGEDFGLGCFVDGEGDDSYSAALAAGVSASQGGGLFLELAGRDRYRLGSGGSVASDTLLPEALWRIEVPGFAVFVDLGGQEPEAWPVPGLAGRDGYWPPQSVRGGPVVGGGYCAVPDSASGQGAGEAR